jgi:hypothetical protein
MFDEKVAKGDFVDSPAERRRFVNGQAGQYNKRFMTYFQQNMQETGLGAFNVAGRNFNRLSLDTLTGDPGAKATSNVAALRMRIAAMVGMATLSLVLPAVNNELRYGSAQPDGTEPGQLIIKKNPDGTYLTMDMKKLSLLARAGRVSGLGSVVDEQIEPRLKGEQPFTVGHTAVSAGKEILRAKLAPFSGPPVNVASAALLGRGDYGIGYNQKTPGEHWPYLGAAVSTINPLAGPIAASPLLQSGGELVDNVRKGNYDPAKHEAVNATKELLKRVVSVVGVKDTTPQLSQVRQWAQAYKDQNKIYSNDVDSAPSLYNPLKQALGKGDLESAKTIYQRIVDSKTQQQDLPADTVKANAMKNIQTEFSKMLDMKFVNKDSEPMFMAQLTPKQREVYTNVKEQQKAVAELFFNAKNEDGTPMFQEREVKTKQKNPFTLPGFRDFNKQKKW